MQFSVDGNYYFSIVIVLKWVYNIEEDKGKDKENGETEKVKKVLNIINKNDIIYM